MKSRVGDKQRLLHMLDAILEIEDYTNNISEEDFANNSMMRFACIKQIEIVGEAANHITGEVKKRYTSVEWAQIVGLRHILIHEYFGVDTALIWQIIRKDIPSFKNEIKDILEDMDS